MIGMISVEGHIVNRDASGAVAGSGPWTWFRARRWREIIRRGRARNRSARRSSS